MWAIFVNCRKTQKKRMNETKRNHPKKKEIKKQRPIGMYSENSRKFDCAVMITQYSTKCLIVCLCLYKSFALSICTWFLKNQVGKTKFDELDLYFMCTVV